MSLLEESERLRIPFGDIKEATKNFTTLIGKGGYGLVYKGELLLSGKLTTVAVKRLQVSLVSGQGFKEFLTEIQLLTRYKHPNLISLVGFCYEGEEKILIYEYAEHGSLDKYLSTAEIRRTLTWKRRLDICVNAARGLNYLHNEAAANERVIHRDIKSANVLLDQNWKAMISDLGLSKLGRANEKDTYLITNASGTYGYCDPEYRKSGILTKESDVYSFGVVLFEVLCGRLCIIDVDNEHRFLPELAKRYYKKGQINDIMDPELQNQLESENQLDSDSLKKVSEIAFKCIRNTRKQRPKMSWVLKKLEELETRLDLQAAEAVSSSTTGTPAEPIEKATVVVKDSGGGGCDSQEPEVRSSDPNKEVNGVDVPEKSPAVDVEGDGQPLVSPMSLGESLMDVEKKTKAKTNGSTGLNRTKKRQLKSNGVAWGKLLSQCPQNPHILMDSEIFTVGQGHQCDLWLSDKSISKSLCNLRHIESQQGGASITLLEITGGKGAVKVNGKICPKRSTLPLRAGDEVIFSSSGRHVYIFQQLSNDNVAADVAPSVSI